MSRTFRNNGFNPIDWDKPWHASGDHGRHFFSSAPKKYLKKLTASKLRAAEQKSMTAYDESEDIPPYKKIVNPWIEKGM